MRNIDSTPLFMVAQLPFNTEDTVILNTPMTEIMNDKGNLQVNITNLKELGIWEHLLNLETRFLEIGCGRGYLLHHLYQEGYGNYYGTEPIISQSQIAMESLLKLGQDKINKQTVKKIIKTNILEQTKFENEYFDYIYSYHVFEHLENPLILLEYGKKWLKPGGKMIIICPNVEGFFPSRDLPSWRCSIPTHRWLPGLSTIKRALEYKGYSIEKYFTYGGYSAERNWINNLFNRWLKIINKGDVMCIMAKKV